MWIFPPDFSKVFFKPFLRPLDLKKSLGFDAVKPRMANTSQKQCIAPWKSFLTHKNTYIMQENNTFEALLDVLLYRNSNSFLYVLGMVEKVKQLSMIVVFVHCTQEKKSRTYRSAGIRHHLILFYYQHPVSLHI